MGHPPFAVTVDLVVLAVHENRLAVLLVERGNEPYAGSWALPGGFVEIDEGLRDAAYRELAEETGLGSDLHLEQLGAYGAPDRDPRMRTVSVAWLGVTAQPVQPTAGSDAAGAQWLPVEEAKGLELAFDHRQILTDGVQRYESGRSA